MNMNKKLTGSLVGLTALLISSVINAATVQLTPATQTVTVGDPVPISVDGIDFFDGTAGGSVNILWDPAKVSLTTPEADIITSLTNLGFNFIPSPVVDAAAGTIDLTFGVFFAPPIPGPTFTLFTLDFLALSPPSIADLALDVGITGGGWGDADGNEIIVDYIGATVTVEAVPVPAAVWLFGSGLIGLVGVARRRV